MITRSVGPWMEHIPGCCTSAILFGFGEHGEPSEVTQEKIKKMVNRELEVVDLGGEVRGGYMKCIFAISVDPANVAILKAAGFKVVDEYEGIQGRVRIMTLHR
jgi:hypothetical protein